MAKKKIKIKKQYLDDILNDKFNTIYTESDRKRNLEEDVDDKVKQILKPIWGNAVAAKKNGK